MDALEAILARHSTRDFSAKPVPRPILEKIIDCAQHAPTARNEQPWHFVVVTDAAVRQQIADLTDYGKFIAQAPVCVVVFCRDTKYYLEDGCAAAVNILVSATALGVQSCWVAGDKKDYGSKIAEMLGLPPGHKLITLLALGYEATPGQRRPRKPLDQILHWEKFKA